MKKEGMIRIRFLLSTAVIAAITAGCANNPLGSSTTQPAAARDYQELSGTWQLTRGVVNGRAVPASEVRRTIVITDGNTFRFPKASGVGTHPAGTFTVNPNTRPKQVDSVGPGGRHAGQVTRGSSGEPPGSSVLEEDRSRAFPLSTRESACLGQTVNQLAKRSDLEFARR